MSTWTKLVSRYRQSDVASPELKAASLAQWIIESGRGKSDLAKQHLNFGGLKYRARMADHATAVDYQGSDGDLTTYCKFVSNEAFLRGYWHFIASGPYTGWEAFATDADGYLGHIAAKGYAADPAYLAKVRAVLGEARDLLGSGPAGGIVSGSSAGMAFANASGRKICVDPGHGMSNATNNVYDPGVVHQENNTPFHEAAIALRYGLTLKDVLRSRGASVFMTRDDETDEAPVGQRAGNAENAGCDLYVSLHLNSPADGSGGANGTEVLYRDAPDIPLATSLCDAVVAAAGTKSRGIKQRTNLAVLRFDGPSALIELGFIHNDGDRTTLTNPQIREAVCIAIADVILAM